MMWVAEIVAHVLLVVIITFGCTAFTASAFFGYPYDKGDEE